MTDPTLPTHPSACLKALGLALPALPKPSGNYVPYVISGTLLYLSGKGAPTREIKPGSTVPKVGAEVSIAQAQSYAREVALFHLATIEAALGDLARVKRFVKVIGLVNATPDFCDHPQVMNGYSDLMVAVFGTRGEHARSAMGAGSLPKGFAVEVEAIVEIG